VNPPGTMAPASGLGSVTSQFCWTPTCGTSRTAPYQFSITVTDNGCPAKSTSEIFSVYVTAGPASLFPAVSIAQTPPGLLCQGSLTTFVANPTLGGSDPHFYWTVNGNPAGTDSSLFSSSTLNNGDVLAVMMISNATCLFTDTAYSAPFVITMSAQPAPQLSITSSPSGTLCPQQLCLFSANLTNGGATPSYQWNINGNNAGTNFPAFTAANPSGIMAVYLTVTPSTGCPPQQSNTIIFNIQPYISPDIVLTASETDSICPGQDVMFQVTSSSTGNPPFYTWTLNGNTIATGVDSLFLPQVNDGDAINVSVTSTYPCLSPAYTYADPLTYNLFQPLAADLTDGPVELCLGTPLDLDLTTTGGDVSTMTYQWSSGASTQASATIIPLTSGLYFGTVDDGCFDPITDSIYVEVLPVPVSDFTWNPEKPSVFIPYVKFTDLSVDAISWQWDLGDQAYSAEQHPEHNYTSGGIFPVQLVTTNDVGCTDTLVRELEVENFITVYIPNSFTPNGDSKNETFGLNGFSTGGYTMSIFNRWGQEVFRSGGDYDVWDGTARDGEAAPAGTYVYLFTINNDKSQKPYTGTVTLVR
jgi:gliding motility-associated-like protein